MTDGRRYTIAGAIPLPAVARDLVHDHSRAGVSGPGWVCGRGRQ